MRCAHVRIGRCSCSPNWGLLRTPSRACSCTSRSLALALAVAWCSFSESCGCWAVCQQITFPFGGLVVVVAVGLFDMHLLEPDDGLLVVAAEDDGCHEQFFDVCEAHAFGVGDVAVHVHLVTGVQQVF